MRCRQYGFVGIVIVAAALLSLPQVAGANSQVTAQNMSETDKAYWLASYFKDHEAVSHYVYESGIAASELANKLSTGASYSHGVANGLAQYALVSLPDLLRNPIFQSITEDIVGEAGKALLRSNITVGDLKIDSAAAIQHVLANFNYVNALTLNIASAKPLIEQYRHENDSSLMIATMNKAIEFSAYAVSTPTFQHVKSIVIEELTKGFKKSNLPERIAKEGTAFLNDRANTMAIVQAVVMNTNIPRLISRTYNASKPVLDHWYKGDTVHIFASAVTAAGGAAQVWKNPTFQFLFKIFGNDFMKTYMDATSHTAQNEENLIRNPVDTYMAILQQMSKTALAKHILSSTSSRMLLPFNRSVEGDKVSESCYEDTIDFLDAAKEGYMWGLKVLDSAGKIPAGLAKGNINFIGSYDECVDIRSDIKANAILGSVPRTGPRYPRSVGTRYCRVRIPIPDDVISNMGVDTKGIPLQITWGLCVPETCHGQDIYGILKLDAIRNRTTMVRSVDCTLDEDLSDDSAAVASICILGVFGFLIACGTLYVSLESLGVFNDSKSEKKDGAVTKENGNYDQLQNVQVESGNESRRQSDRKDIPSGYVPHSETDEPPTNKIVENGREQQNEVSKKQSESADTYHKQKTTHDTLRKKKEGVLVRILKAFALQINVPKILTGKTGPSSINCIHGIRFYSITWIMLGHTYNYGLVSNASQSWSIVNVVDVISVIQRFTFQAVVAAGFSVDTFFMISGMLLTYIQLKQMAKIKAKPTGAKIGNYVYRYLFHRFWRLTPMYGLVLMIYTTLLMYIGNGPLWPTVIESSDNCKASWWTNMLYVNNLVKTDHQCMGWSWFLANDMQFYVVAIIPLFFLTLNLPLGVFVSAMMLVAGIVSASWKEYIYNGNFFTMKSDGGKYWNNVYITPWCRVGAYCVGLLLGVLLYKRPRKAFSRVIGLIGWVTATGAALALVYSTYDVNKKDGATWTHLQNALYEGLGRPVWSLCVAWVVFACHNDMGGFVNTFLSWKGIIPLSRISYAAYLIHPILMVIYVYSKRSLFYLSDFEIIYLFLGHTSMTFMGAFVVSIAFEAPFMALEKLIL